MKEYIDKSALVAEIKRLSEYVDSYHEQRTMGKILLFLDTLEVKEVELEKEIEDVKHNYKVDDNRHTSICSADIEWLAKHFFELGLKAKQESNDGVKIGEAEIYLEDGGESPYDGTWLDLSCEEYDIPETLFEDGDNVEILIRKAQKGE